MYQPFDGRFYKATKIGVGLRSKEIMTKRPVTKLLTCSYFCV